MPAGRRKRLILSSVPLDVPTDLRHPVSGVMATLKFCDACLKIPTMPEVAVTEDDHSMTGKDNVRPPWETGNVEPVPKPGAPEFVAKKQFTPCVGFGARAA